MWWRQRGPAGHWWVRRSAGTTLGWFCHNWLKQWECSRSWQPCHRFLLSGHGALPKGGRHPWPRFSPGSHQNPASVWENSEFGKFITNYSCYCSVTHRKYPSTGAVKDYTVHRREVAKNAFMYLHVLVGRWWHNLVKAGRACSSPGSHGGHFPWGHEDN